MCNKKSSQDSLRPKFDMSDNGKELLYTHVMNENGTYTECDRECRSKLSPEVPEQSSSAEQEKAYIFQKFSIIYLFAIFYL